MLIGERPLAQAVKFFERADPITLPFISPESKFDPGNLIGRLKKRFLKRLLLVKCATILSKPVLTFNLTKLHLGITLDARGLLARQQQGTLE